VVFFEVGAQDVETYASHSALICKQPPVCNAMLNGQMKEALEARVRLDVVDKDTFARFADYSYGGDHNPASADVVPDLNFMTLQAPSSQATAPTGGVGTLYGSMRANRPFGSSPKHSPGGGLGFGSATSVQPVPVMKRPQDAVDDFPLPNVESNAFPALRKADYKNGSTYGFAEVAPYVMLHAFAEKYELTTSTT
jgi:hypothetical protein